MAFKGITFAGQNVTPKNDGGLYNAHYGDGILWGCSMALSGDDLVIQSGEFIMGGRYVQVDGATPVDLSGRTLQTGYIQVIMNADLTQAEGSQWYPTFVESATTTFPTLTEGNINDNDTLYQLELAVVQISGGNLTSITTSLLPSFLFVYDASGNKRARFRGNDNVGAVEILDNNGDVAGGIITNHGSGKTYIIGNDGIGLYPNSLADTLHTVEFKANGDISGISKVYIDDVSSESKSVAANSNTGVASIQLPAGKYIISGHIRHACSVSTVQLKRIGFATVSGGFGILSNSILCNTTSGIEYSISCIWELTAQTTVWLNWGAFGSAGTITAHRLQALKIA